MSGLTFREFARRDGCDERLVRRKVASGHLPTIDGKTIHEAFVGSTWRKSAQAGAATVEEVTALIGHGETNEEAAERLVFREGRVFDTEADAKRHKESYLAHLRQIEFDQKSGSVVAVEDVARIVAGEYAAVRSALLAIPSKIAPRVALMKSAEEVRSALDAAVSEALEGLTSDGTVSVWRS